MAYTNSGVCRYFSTTGTCYYGDSCNFLHERPPETSLSSLSTPFIPKNQRPCRNLALHGFCKFGKSCEYSHEIDKMGMGQEQLQVGQPGSYFYPYPQVMAPQVSYNPYTTLLPHTTRQDGKRAMQSFFMPEDIRHEFYQRSANILSRVPFDDPRINEIPPAVHRFHTLVPLDSLEEKSATIFGYSTTSYKCISSTDGLPYLLRRIDGYRVLNDQSFASGEIWYQLTHPSIVSLKEVFVTKDFFGFHTLCFAYDYHPNSKTMSEFYFRGNSIGYIAENVIWSFISQIASALVLIHNSNLAARIIHPSKILITSKNRIRLNGVGIFDVINKTDKLTIGQFQQEDLYSFGKLLLYLACNSMNALVDIKSSLQHVASQYSPELHSFIVMLLTRSTADDNPISIHDIIPLISLPLIRNIEYLHEFNDQLEAEFAKEVENGRLFRLLTKLSFINERPEFGRDTRWSETGDRYLLKLFRDYVFHQTYEDGNPAVDFAHVVDNLNKLDVGVTDKIVLMSRNEKSILVVSYEDLKRCLDGAFEELISKQKQF